MNCRETEALLTAYVDDELDLVRSLEGEQHLGECRACASALRRQRAVKQAVAEHAPCYRAPEELRKLVERQAAAHFGSAHLSSAAHSGPFPMPSRARLWPATCDRCWPVT